MKKFIIAILVVVCYSCSSSDDNNSNSSQINPPSWIQGTWINDLGTGGFNFTTDNICVVTGNLQQCYKEILEQTDGSVVEENVTEEITDDIYFIEFTLSSSITTYEFERVSDTEILYINNIMNTILIKQ